MGQFFQNNIPQLVVASTTQLTLAATNNGQPTSLQIGGQGYALSTALTLNTATVGFNGIDTGTLAANTLYYVYAVVSAGVVGMVISLSATAPAGFAQYVNIGRCRTFLGSSGLSAVATWLNGQLVGNPNGEYQTDQIVLTGSTANPTTGTGTNKMSWKRNVSTMECQIEFYQSNAGTAGTGAYLFGVPNSKSLASSPLDASLYNGSGANYLGSGQMYDANTSSVYDCQFFVFDATRIQIQLNKMGAAQTFGFASTTISFANAGLRFSSTLFLPIAEWAGLYS